MSDIKISGQLGPKHGKPETKVDSLGVRPDEAEVFYRGLDKGLALGRESTRHSIFSMNLIEFWIARRRHRKWARFDAI